MKAFAVVPYPLFALAVTAVARTFTTELNPADKQAIVQDLKRQLEAIQNLSLAVERRDDQGGTLPLAIS
jgi:hypothetical protein